MFIGVGSSKGGFYKGFEFYRNELKQKYLNISVFYLTNIPKDSNQEKVDYIIQNGDKYFNKSEITPLGLIKEIKNSFN